MEFANLVRHMTQEAVINHVAAMEKQMESELHLYMNCVLPMMTRMMFEEVTRNSPKETEFHINYPSSNPDLKFQPASIVTLRWRHPVIAGIGPGFFQISSKEIIYGLNGNLDTRVQNKVREYLRERGWTCWWTVDSFCFQDRLDFDIVERGMKLFACYRNEGAGELLLTE